MHSITAGENQHIIGFCRVEQGRVWCNPFNLNDREAIHLCAKLFQLQAKRLCLVTWACHQYVVLLEWLLNFQYQYLPLARRYHHPGKGYLRLLQYQ